MANTISDISPYRPWPGDTTLSSRHSLRAMAVGCAERTPNARASYEALAMTPRRPTPPTATGRFRSVSSLSLSTSTKNASMSTWRIGSVHTWGSYLDPGAGKAKLLPMAALVHLVRHGEVDNPEHLVYADLPGFGLSPHGVEQARRVGRYLGPRPVVAVWSSPLERSLRTAEEIAGRTGVPVKIAERCSKTAYGRSLIAKTRYECTPRSTWRNPCFAKDCRQWKTRFATSKNTATRKEIQQRTQAVLGAFSEYGRQSLKTRRRRRPVLISCARGGLIDEVVLNDVLNSGQISGTGLDVPADEPWNSQI